MAIHKTISAVSEKNILNNNARKMEKKKQQFLFVVGMYLDTEKTYNGCRLSRDLTRLWDQRIMWLYGQEPIK